MKYLLLAVIAACICASCNQQTQRPHLTEAQRAARMDSLRSDLLKTDLAFSELTEKKGRNAGYSEYADSSATLLRPWNKPLTGKNSIMNLLAGTVDTGIALSWLPVRADVARSGDIGYTYGTYVIESSNTDRTGGTYCTIWKKDSNKKWKFVVITGNDGLTPE